MIDTLLVALVIMPFATTASTIYLWSLYVQSSGSRLAFMLAASSTVTLFSASWIGALTVNVRFLGRANDPALVPVTLIAILAPLASINVMAFVLWRSRG